MYIIAPTKYRNSGLFVAVPFSMCDFVSMIRKSHFNLWGDLMVKYSVEPLRTAAEIEEMRNALYELGGDRDRFLLTFGINTGLRASDIVKFKVGDVLGKPYADIIEQKTGKNRRVHLLAIQPDIVVYCQGMSDGDYLFPSRSGGHIGAPRVYEILKRAGEWIGRTDIGSHTMRKSFGWHYYQRTKDVAALMEVFGHSAPSITKRYIGIRDAEIAESLRDFRL